MKNKTISHEATIEFIEKKSKFIGYIKPISTVQEAENFIKYIKSIHSDATHNVPLYRVIVNGNEVTKYNDDNEPSGTAGNPMAEIARVRKLFNFSLVAVRYYGGIKLGAGGLIRAYAKTAKLLFNEAGETIPDNKIILRIEYPYQKTLLVKDKINKDNIEVIEETYTDKVVIKVKIDEQRKEELFKELGNAVKLSEENAK